RLRGLPRAATHPATGDTRNPISLLMAGYRLTLPSGSWPSTHSECRVEAPEARTARAAAPAVPQRLTRARHDRPVERNHARARTEWAPPAATHPARPRTASILASHPRLRYKTPIQTHTPSEPPCTLDLSPCSPSV